MKVNVKIKRLHPDAVIPRYAHEFDAGFDLVAVEDTIIEPGETKLVRTGLAMSLPPNYELQIRPRSGISLKTKLRVANAPGTVDAGYRGEIGVIVDNISREVIKRYDKDGQLERIMISGQALSMVKTIDGNYVDVGKIIEDGTYIIRKGDRIAQGVIKPVEQAHFVEVDELDETDRGAGGFGSSGLYYEDSNENARCRKCGSKVEGGYCDCFNKEERK
jgi:dUTP pyrophosphatase